MKFENAPMRLTTHEDFNFRGLNNQVDSYEKDVKVPRIWEVPGGWVLHNYNSWNVGQSQTMCFVPFPEKYVYIEQKEVTECEK